MRLVALTLALMGVLGLWSMLTLAENGAPSHTGEKVASTTLMVTSASVVRAGERLSLAVTENWKGETRTELEKYSSIANWLLNLLNFKIK